MSLEATELREEHARLLRERAESYWRDSHVLIADGDSSLALCYQAFADELRRLADVIQSGEDHRF